MTTTQETRMTSAEAKAAIKGELASFADAPNKFPRALAARARMPHRYSVGNMMLILAQSMGDPDILADRIMPRTEWAKLGYVPAGPAFGIWSKPFKGFTDGENVTFRKGVAADMMAAGGDKVHTFQAFRVVPTYPARFVKDGSGQTAETRPEPLEGTAADVYATLVEWLTGLGWTVEHRNVDGAGGWTAHSELLIRIDPRFTGWDRVRVLVHETAHALMHGEDDKREYAGEHRGDMEAEADGVAYAVLTAYGQTEAAARTVAYVAGWASGDVARIESALERASAALDAIMGTLAGEDVEIRKPKTAKGDNRALAAWLRERDLPANGEVWRAAKGGERDVSKLTALREV